MLAPTELDVRDIHNLEGLFNYLSKRLNMKQQTSQLLFLNEEGVEGWEPEVNHSRLSRH